MKCPICPDVVLSVGNREGIEIDYCPRCRGIWLDRNELDKIIERSARLDSDLHHESDRGRGSARAPEPHQGQHPPHFGSNNDSSHGNFRYQDPHRKKKGGWLGDLLDF